MSQFHVWQTKTALGRENALIIKADDSAEAAQKWAKWQDQMIADYGLHQIWMQGNGKNE